MASDIIIQGYFYYFWNMPTVLYLNGWRLYFYANENNEPPHIHVQKGDMEAKIWLRQELFDIEEDYSYRMNSKDRKEIRRIIFNHFDYLIESWNQYHQSK
jgi:hypothetical protein